MDNTFDEDFLWLFQKAEYAAICLSLDYRVVDITQAAETLFCVLRKKILDISISSLFEQAGLEIAFFQDKKTPSFKISYSNTQVKSLSAQKILKLDWKIKQKHAPNGEPSGFVLYTEKQVNEERLFMQRLAGSIAHEIRTPLAIININVDLLKRSKDEEAKEKYIEIIKYAIRLASYIIDNILIMIRTMSSGERAQIEFCNMSIKETVEDALKIYPFLEQEKTLVIFDKSKDFVYYGDKILTKHVLFNLIKNALFSIKEAGKGDIKIKLEKNGSSNKLIFTDTALGISEKELPYIFDKFAAKKAGSGLGLSFCKTVMQSYGGDINCSSCLGKYTEFTLSFPK